MATVARVSRLIIVLQVRCLAATEVTTMIGICSWVFMTISALLSLATNFVFLPGCISPPAVNLALHRVNVELVVIAVRTSAFNNTKNAPKLMHPALPVYWYFGSSGICDVSESETPIRCRREFPPTSDLVTLVKDSLRDSGQVDEKQADAIASSWETAIDALDPSLYRDKQPRANSQSKASVAFTILAVMLDLILPAVAL
ncbi:hypothetical protein B0T14DRAFT_499285 [Immersiella caudata]|uniref:Uncharacterized protein n=1 Tax=Immersiella caudata TaxID=314043 RepID=A0AA40BUB4_9PEZI|nr:hypothetical protein B0T14DRAFT_499285 [Immersiella caudata]